MNISLSQIANRISLKKIIRLRARNYGCKPVDECKNLALRRDVANSLEGGPRRREAAAGFLGTTAVPAKLVTSLRDPASFLIYKREKPWGSILPFAICHLLFAILLGCQKQQLYKDNRVMMGTFVEVTSPDKEAAGIVFAEIKRIENLLSKYNPDSEISKLNKSGNLKVSPGAFFVIKKSLEFWQASDGAFDISVGPLIDLWGFTDKKYYLPKDAEINQALERVGMNKIILNDKDNVIQFKVLGMKIDLGAIAKGYALDCAVDKLRRRQIKSCLVNAGGDIYCAGNKFGRPWRVAIQDPQGKDFLGYLELEDKAVATSGDYAQYFIKDKKRYAHIFNPKTGYPINSGVVSVTVIAPDCLTADALATAIFVLGKTKGEALAKKFSDVKIKIVEGK